jgi:general stress protein YciG
MPETQSRTGSYDTSLSSSAAGPQGLTPDGPPQTVRDEAGEAAVKRPRGFAAMDRKLVSDIARKGGKAAHSAGTAHEFTTEEARIAGQKGGRATHARRRRTNDELPEREPKLDARGPSPG